MSLCREEAVLALCSSGRGRPPPLLHLAAAPSRPARPADNRPACPAHAPGAQAQRLLLNIGETTVGVPFSKEQAVQLDAAFSQLLKTVRRAPRRCTRCAGDYSCHQCAAPDCLNQPASLLLVRCDSMHR